MTIKDRKNVLNLFARTGTNYCPQVFLEECKYILKEKKIPDDILLTI